MFILTAEAISNGIWSNILNFRDWNIDDRMFIVTLKESHYNHWGTSLQNFLPYISCMSYHEFVH